MCMLFCLLIKLFARGGVASQGNGKWSRQFKKALSELSHLITKRRNSTSIAFAYLKNWNYSDIFIWWIILEVNHKAILNGAVLRIVAKRNKKLCETSGWEAPQSSAFDFAPRDCQREEMKESTVILLKEKNGKRVNGKPWGAPQSLTCYCSRHRRAACRRTEE